MKLVRVTEGGERHRYYGAPDDMTPERFAELMLVADEFPEEYFAGMQPKSRRFLKTHGIMFFEGINIVNDPSFVVDALKMYKEVK